MLANGYLLWAALHHLSTESNHSWLLQCESFRKSQRSVAPTALCSLAAERFCCHFNKVVFFLTGQSLSFIGQCSFLFLWGLLRCEHLNPIRRRTDVQHNHTEKEAPRWCSVHAPSFHIQLGTIKGGHRPGLLYPVCLVENSIMGHMKGKTRGRNLSDPGPVPFHQVNESHGR